MNRRGEGLSPPRLLLIHGDLMPTVEIVETYSLPVAELFAFFVRPANVLAVAPLGSGLRLVNEGEGEYTVEARRWGLTSRIVTEVIECQPDECIIERQKRGPFAAWRLSRHFRAVEGGTEVREVVEFEPPGGLLGLILTASRIEAELRTAYKGRAERVQRRLTPARP